LVNSDRQTLLQKIAAMKAIVPVGVIVVVAFGIFVVLSVMQREATDKLIQEDASGFFRDNKQNAEAARGSNPEKIFPPTVVSGPSWLERIQNAVEDCWRAIKNLSTSNGGRILHHPRPAPPGFYFTLTYLSVRTRSGVTGFNAGTQVVCVKDNGPVLTVKAGNVEFEAQRQYLTNDLNVAELAVKNDAEAQQQVASYIAQQQQAIEQRDDKRKTQPLGQH